jgi:hypothetical protein
MTFKDVTEIIIDNFEGGYYHPNMLIDGRVKDGRYGSSGETMFGIDRKNGGAINTTAAGREFWSIRDNAGANKKWSWNYKGGDLAPKLKDLTAKMMEPLYESWGNRYLSPEAKKLADKDDRLKLHFSYALWNGEGWFKKFASDINDAVAKGVKDTDQLVNVSIASRTAEGLKKGSSPNSLIVQTGNKMKALFLSYADKFNKYGASGIFKSFLYAPIAFVKRNPIPVALTVALIGLTTTYFIIKSKK